MPAPEALRAPLTATYTCLGEGHGFALAIRRGAHLLDGRLDFNLHTLILWRLRRWPDAEVRGV